MPAFDNTYEPGKRLTCLCGRVFATERGLKQHIRVATKNGVKRGVTPVLSGHGRCFTATARLMVQYMAKDAMATLDFYKKLRETTIEAPKPASFVKYTRK